VAEVPAPLAIGQRLEEYYRRLTHLAPAHSAAEAFEQVCRTLEEVEDELSGIQKQIPTPRPNRPDGRMYPPLEDFTVSLPDGGIEAKTRGHTIQIGADGSIRIVNRRTGEVEFKKQGLAN
jgi:hypothetical protein